jgi:hypothetical protein
MRHSFVDTKDPLNLPDAEFDAVMTEIDRELRQRTDKITGREFLGFVEYCSVFKISIDTEHPTTRRIFDWFIRMYGQRLSMDWDFGRSVVFVNGELCKVRGIRFFGTMLFVCAPTVVGRKLRQATSDGIIPVNNLLESIEGLTPVLAARLSPDECSEMLKAYSRMYIAFSKLEAAQGSRYGGGDAPYVKEAVHDLIVSTESLLSSSPNYGLSKYASLQAVEKVLKSCIPEKGGTHKYSHNLTGLAAEAAKWGVPGVDAAQIAAVQCPAAVRYHSTLVAKGEAVAAHYAALTVCGQLAPILKGTTAQSDACDYEFALPDGAKLSGIRLGYVSPAPPFTLSSASLGAP